MPELSRPVPLAAVLPSGRTERVEASAAECEALARRYRIEAVERLEADIALRPEPGDAVLAEGELRARVVQACVVTLEPVPQEVKERLVWRFLPPGREPADGPDDADDIPTEGVADLGEALAEQLALALDPYPRAPGAVLAEVAGSAATAPPAAPFAVLERLRSRR